MEAVHKQHIIRTQRHKYESNVALSVALSKTDMSGEKRDLT